MVNISDYSSLETNINLISPVNNYVTSNSSVIFNGTVSSSNPIQSVTLDINGLFNQTDHSGINNTNYIFIVNGLIGSNNWSYTVCDTYNFCNTSNTNTFTVLSNTIFTDVNITDNLIVGQNLSALNGFFNSLGNLLQPILNLFVTNAMISTATITNLNVTGLLYGDGSHLTNIPMTNSSYYLATNPNNYTAYGITWYNAMNGTLALMSNLSDYYLASNPSNYYNNITLQNLSQLRDNLGGRGYTSLSNFTNNEGFYNSTNPPPANEPNWNGNASNVAYTNKANIFNGSINVLGNSNVTGNSTVTYTHYNSQALATCGASYYGDIGRNSSGLYYCSSTSKWIRLASG
jgi:hypothetical protein